MGKLYGQNPNLLKVLTENHYHRQMAMQKGMWLVNPLSQIWPRVGSAVAVEDGTQANRPILSASVAQSCQWCQRLFLGLNAHATHLSRTSASRICL